VKIAILGATKGMGRSLARRMVERGDLVHLLGRDTEALARCAQDLQVRSQARAAVEYTLCDLERPEQFEPALNRARDAMGGLDTVVVTAGLFATQAELERDPELTRRLLVVDFAHTVVFCERARTLLLSAGGGTLCVFSSVAGERGRKPVVLYGAAKAGLTRYLEGLDHRFRTSGLRVVCVKPGFVRTEMTRGLPEPPFAADADDIAGPVLRAIDRGTPVVYAPAVWWAVMAVIRLLPRAVMRRVRF
jgi:NAD(P)-dependent dehydrogenase (short-subunit alcohol dehydrogenase family)